ncbi:MAG: CHAT domain-containing protein, partial [Myxococcales bacterium]|nr:CHAT domain-containing protein [Myxococcales bacterium]
MRDEGLTLLLDFARIDAPEDPFAFRFAPQGYTLRTPGGGLDRVDVPWSAELLADLDALRGPDPDPAVVQRVGERLAAVLRPAGWPALASELLTASAAGRPVRVTLRSNAAELYALPWELLTVGASGQHLGELPGVLLRHAWPATETAAERPSPRPEGSRMLFAWSAAGGAVPASEHGQALTGSWFEGHLDRDPATDVVSHASAASLARALKAAADAGEPYVILHLLAHGGRRGATSGLVLDGDDGRPHVVDAGRLRQLLAPFAASLRLVVIAACDGGDVGDPGNHLGSVAQALHRAGIQAVVASRYPLSIAGSTILAESLYRGLAVELRSLEGALLVTRQRLAEEVAPLDWAGLQLYARAEDGDDTRPIVVRPFRGLEVFEARHRRLLFGRDAEIAEAAQELAALRRADAPRIYLVSGASGSGKSSLVRAGVLPRIAPDFAAVHVARPDADDDPPPARPLLYVLDQAEEMFTTLDADARARLLAGIYALATDSAGSAVLMTLRADFSGRCGELVLPDGRRLDRLEADD